MDARALGWVGQRVFRYAGRDQIAASSKSYFNDMEDMHTQIVRSLRGRNASFGQLLMPEIEKALCWAFATPGSPGDVFDLPPPLKQAENVNDVWTGSLLAPGILYKACSGLESGAPGRTEERWLMLDEPEVGLSIPLQVKVMATLLRVAEIGPARVFMASHSPLVLSLVNHPLVQVVDMSGGWLEAAQYAMQVLNTPKALSTVGAQTEKDLRAAVAKQQKEQEKARLAKEK